MAHDILIVDDELDIRTQISGILEDCGYMTRQAANSSEALEAMAGRQPALVILDVWLGVSEMDGLETLEIIRRDYPDQQVVMISGHATFDMAVSATKMGAYDFITKPFKTDVLLHNVERALREQYLQEEVRELKKRAGPQSEDIIGTSQVMVHLRRQVDQLSEFEGRVLISGPPGSGKSLVARAIHRGSDRVKRRFITLNCATLETDGGEAVLFGADPVKGRPRAVGIFERSHGGTLVLDEVGSLSPGIQEKIVGILQGNSFRRLGGSKLIDVDVRVIATTRLDLKGEVAAGNFNEELFHRLNVVPVEVPPLHSRLKDMSALTRYLMARIAGDKGQQARGLSPEALSTLEAYNWPGNVSELCNVIERLLLTAPADPSRLIDSHSVALAIGGGSKAARWEAELEVMNQPLREAREAFEKEYLLFHVRRFGGNISRTAEFVGMDRAALHRKLKMLGVGLNDKTQRMDA
ncbi:MAG: sigma-54 dependent transcriptional regulator [Alphaproteobacteria bacterium]|nr:sigma-54 dependent transcriptional regulator [Alphaproteobacteria bacterium]